MLDYSINDWMLAASQMGDQSAALPKFSEADRTRISAIQTELNAINDPTGNKQRALLKSRFSPQEGVKFAGAFSMPSPYQSGHGFGDDFDVFDNIALPMFFALTGANAIMAATGVGAGSAAALPSDLLTVGGTPLTTAQAGGLVSGLEAPVLGAGAGGITVSAGGLTGTAPVAGAGSITVPGAVTEGLAPVSATGPGAITGTSNGILNSATKVTDFLKEHPSSVKTIVEQLMPGNSGMSAEDWANLDEQERIRIANEEAERAGNRNISGVSMRTQPVQPLTYRGSNQPVYTNGILNRRTGP